MKYVLIGLVAVLVLLIGFLAGRKNQPPSVKPELISVSFAGGKFSCTFVSIQRGLNEPRDAHDPNARSEFAEGRYVFNSSNGAIVLEHEVFSPTEFKLRVSCSRPLLLHMHSGSGLAWDGTWTLINQGVQTMWMRLIESGEIYVFQTTPY